MLKFLRNAGFAIVASLLLLWGCGTDVPISNNTSLSDNRLLGYWQSKNGGVLYCRQMPDGKTTLTAYEFDQSEKQFVAMDEKPYALYFADLKDKQGTVQFFSFGDDDSYFTSRFELDKEGQLLLSSVSDNYLKTEHGKMKDDTAIFGKPERFQKFAKKHMRKSGFFEETEVYQRRQSFQDLTPPVKS